MNNLFLVTKYVIKMLQKFNYTCSKVKIMKILYFAKGHFYQERDTELFGEHFEAWINGPVVRDAYRVLTYEYNWSYTSESVSDEEVAGLSDDIKRFIEKVAFLYGQYNDTTLVEASHNETPWISARKGYGSMHSSTQKINEAEIKNFYKQLDRKLCDNGSKNPVLAYRFA